MSDMGTDFRITVRLPGELRRRLKAAARRGGTKESEVVRVAVERQLAAEEAAPTVYDQLQKAGLVGSVRGAARDLSSNPAHFDGFGRS
jgi:predicted DNA-binding protein